MGRAEVVPRQKIAEVQAIPTRTHAEVATAALRILGGQAVLHVHDEEALWSHFGAIREDSAWVTVEAEGPYLSADRWLRNYVEADLGKKFASLESWCRKEVAIARREAATALVEVERLRTELLRTDDKAADPLVAWMEANSEVLRSHRGQRVAIHPKLGIVASGTDFLTVYEEVKRLGLLDEVVFDSVPSL